MTGIKIGTIVITEIIEIAEITEITEIIEKEVKRTE